MSTRKFQKEVQFEHRALPPFESELTELMELAFEGGIRSLAKHGFKLDDELVNPEALEHFKDGVFVSIGQAQNRIGAAFIELEKKRLELQKSLDPIGRPLDKEYDGVRDQLNTIRVRQQAFRRFADGLIQLLLPEGWTTRKFIFQKQIQRPDITELTSLLALAESRNHGQTKSIHIVSDLTSFIQIGDLIRVRRDGESVFIQIEEIKTGSLNHELCGLINSNGCNLTDADLADVEARLGIKARSQASRMIRQQRRIETAIEGLDCDRLEIATDPNDMPTQASASLNPPAFGTYLHILPDLALKAETDALVTTCLDGCLWITVVSMEGIAGRLEINQLPHHLFHLKNPDRACSPAEIPALAAEPPLVNLIEYGMRHALSRSPFTWYPKEFALSAILNRVRVYAQFDFQVFFAMAAEFGMTLSLISHEKANGKGGRRMSSPLVAYPKATAIQARFSNGNVCYLESWLMDMVYSHLVPPVDILKLLVVFDRTQT